MQLAWRKRGFCRVAQQAVEALASRSCERRRPRIAAPIGTPIAAAGPPVTPIACPTAIAVGQATVQSSAFTRPPVMAILLSRALRSCERRFCSRVRSEVGINFERYPIDAPSSAKFHAVVEGARHALVESGCASFPEFLTSDATDQAAAEAAAKAPSAFVTNSTHNAWQLPFADPAYPAEDVRNLEMHTRVASTAYDELSDDGPLRRLYHFDPFVAFVGAVTTQAHLHRLADPLGACSVNVFRPGWHHAWHFDEAEYTTTLSLQQSEEGGEFEFTPPLRRTQDDLAEAAVARVLCERSPYRPTRRDAAAADEPSSSMQVTAAPFAPGTLQIFAGRYSLHHVKRVPPTATRDRLVAVLCFATRPGVVNSPSVQQMFWGRTAQA